MSVIPQSVLLWKTVAVAAVVFTVFWVGRGHGIQLQTERTAKTVAFKDGHLHAAARTLAANARTFKAIDATTAANKLAAGKRAKQARLSNSEAEDDRKHLIDEVERLNRQTEAENMICPEGRTPICGEPLR